MWLLYVQLLGGKTDTRLWESLLSILPEPSTESVHYGGFTFVQGGLIVEIC